MSIKKLLNELNDAKRMYHGYLARLEQCPECAASKFNLNTTIEYINSIETKLMISGVKYNNI